jgi:hypothetical protein
VLLGRDFGCLPSEAMASITDTQLQAWLLIREAEAAELERLTHR